MKIEEQMARSIMSSDPCPPVDALNMRCTKEECMWRGEDAEYACRKCWMFAIEKGGHLAYHHRMMKKEAE